MSKAKEDLVPMHHMLDAAQKIVKFIQNSNRADLEKDEKLSLSIVRLLEIIGEAARNVSDQCQDMYPEIPWRQMAGMRNRLIHGYFDVDLNIVWKIATIDLPALITELQQALSSNSE